MRILLVSHHYPPDAVGGVERITQALASDLRALGENVSIVARRFGPEGVLETEQEQSPEGCAIYRLTGGSFSDETFLHQHQELENRFGQILHDVAPDIVHILHLRGLSPRFIELARARGSAVIVSLHDFYFACPRITLLNTGGEWCAGPDGGATCVRTCFAKEGTRAIRWELRARYWERVLGLAQRVICPSRYIADFFQAHGVKPALVRVITNGVSLPPLASWEQSLVPAPDGALKLVFLGSVLPHKGVHLILDALECVPVGAVDLVVAGAADDDAYVQRLRAQAAGIPGLRMRFLGAYEMNELAWLLDDVTCVITPSVWQEVYGMVTREALRRGVPVIVSRVGGLAEAVVEGVNGFTFNPAHPQELGVLLQRLAQQADLRARLRAGALATPIVTTFEHAQRVRAVYFEAQGEAQQRPLVVDDTFQKSFDVLRAQFGDVL